MLSKLNRRLLYVNVLLISGIALIAAVSAFNGPTATPPGGNATGILGLTQGGTGANTASGARSAIGAAASGPNSDITSLTGLTTPLSVSQGGTGTTTLTGVIIGNTLSPFTSILPGAAGNVLTSNGSSWISQALSGGGSNLGVFGSGTDGSVTYSSSTVLTQDLYAQNLTVNSGVTLYTGGYRIFANGTVTIQGTIDNSGGTGSTVTSGSGGASSSIGGGAAGGSGANASGCSNANGGSATILHALGGTGGTGGSGGGNVGDSCGAFNGGCNGGGSGSVSISYAKNRLGDLVDVMMMSEAATSTGAFSLLNAGDGGAGGGAGCSQGSGGGGGQGGGGGGGGGIVFIAAPTVTIQSGGVISANGGAGGNGSTSSGTCSGGGGGGGGGGGAVVLLYKTFNNSGSISVAAGGAGTGGGAGGGPACSYGNVAGGGTNGTAGSAGKVYLIQAQ